MMVLKGDIVRLADGEKGEVTETWGIARTFLRVLRSSDKQAIIAFETQVAEIISRNQHTTKGRGKKK